MKTKIKSIHEEEYVNKSRTIGVLLNYSLDNDWNESLVYIFNSETNTYIFFNVIIDMINYLLYGEDSIKRAYMPEVDFDNLFDSDFILGSFTDQLKWS